MALDDMDVRDRDHRRIRCPVCRYQGWSDDTGACPQCDARLARRARCAHCGAPTLDVGHGLPILCWPCFERQTVARDMEV